MAGMQFRPVRPSNYREIVLILSKISCRLVINARGRILCESGAFAKSSPTRADVCVLVNQTEEKFHRAKSVVSQESFSSDCLTVGASITSSILFSPNFYISISSYFEPPFIYK